MQNHRTLRVYHASARLAVEVYTVTKTLPAEERFGLGDQLRRGAISVGSNIVEGCGRQTSRDLCSFLDRSLGSARELEFQLEHCIAASLTDAEAAKRALLTCCCVQSMLTRLIIKVRRDANRA